MDARHERARQDGIGDLVRKGNWVTITASGQTTVVTANGKTLGNVGGISEKNRLQSLDKILKVWESLPESERKLGKIDLGPPDAKRPLVEPPADCLIVRIYNRQLEWEANGNLRYTQPEDYPENARNAADRYRESAQDTMWIPASEWKAFIPENPRKGQTSPAPTAFALRLFKYHLDPERGLGEGITFGGAKADSGKITFTVEEVTEDIVQLRLDGMAKLIQGRPDGQQTSFEPVLLGHLSYSVRNRTFTRLEILALGEVTNTPRGVRPGAHPLGIAFELVLQPTVAERVVPRGGRDNVERYLQLVNTAK